MNKKTIVVLILLFAAKGGRGSELIVKPVLCLKIQKKKKLIEFNKNKNFKCYKKSYKNLQYKVN
jgi:hypothetical protein